jgi:hypothetical protein
MLCGYPFKANKPLSAAHSAPAPAPGFARANVNHATRRRRPRIYKRLAIIVHCGGASLAIDSLDDIGIARSIRIGGLPGSGHIHGCPKLGIEPGCSGYACGQNHCQSHGQPGRDIRYRYRSHAPGFLISSLISSEIRRHHQERAEARPGAEIPAAGIPV